MGDEIEAYILKKLDDAITEASSADFNIAAKIFFFRPTLAQQFEALKKLLTKNHVPAAAVTDGSNTAPAVAAAAAAAAGDGAEESNTRREQLYYLNNVLAEWQMITKKPFSIRESITSLKDLRQSLKKIKQDLKRGDGGSIHTQASNLPVASDCNSIYTSNADGTAQAASSEEPHEYRWSTQYMEKEVHGIEDKVLSMERLLVLQRDKNDPFKAFGIFGMAGIGKTTLCQSIFFRPKVIEYFFPRIWVCMSKQEGEDSQNRREIVVKRMLVCLGLDKEIINKTEERKGLQGLVFALRLQLTGKRYLIVLDDAWSNDKWFKMMDSGNKDDNSSSKKFAYGFPKGCGGTVIVTGRMKEVVKNMVGEEQNLRCLTPHTDNETCWNIFKDWVQTDGIAFPPELEALKEEIVKRCDGLPLAAKMMGEINHQKLVRSAEANQAEAGQQAA